ncbi:hypothetical protein Tco_0643028, partial [Tanacetum coccineum]
MLANVEPQSDPSPRPSPTPHIPDSILEVSSGNQGGHSSSDRSLSGTEGGMTLQSVYDLSKVGRQESLKSNWMQKFCIQTGDEGDEVSTEDVLSTAQQKVSTDKEKVSTDKPNVSTDRPKVSTNKEKVSTDRPNVSTDIPKVSTDKEKDSTISTDEGTVDQTEGRRATPTTPTTTLTMFGYDETIAQVLLNMSQAKAVSREKEKGVELKDVEETERPRPISTRSLLTLKPLPKIDPKDKGKKKIKEEDESKTKFEEEERKRLAEEEATKTSLSDEYDFIQARIKANRLLAPRLQDKEREQFTVEEREKFLHDTIAAQRRFLAEQRAIAIKNKPPTRTQLRNQMMTYLMHVGNKKHSD